LKSSGYHIIQVKIYDITYPIPANGGHLSFTINTDVGLYSQLISPIGTNSSMLHGQVAYRVSIHTSYNSFVLLHGRSKHVGITCNIWTGSAIWIGSSDDHFLASAIMIPTMNGQIGLDAVEKDRARSTRTGQQAQCVQSDLDLRTRSHEHGRGLLDERHRAIFVTSPFECERDDFILLQTNLPDTKCPCIYARITAGI